MIRSHPGCLLQTCLFVCSGAAGGHHDWVVPLLCFIQICVRSHLCCHYWVGRVGGGLLRGGGGYFGGGFRALRGGLLWGGLLQGYFQNRLRWVTSGFKINKISALRADNSFFMSFRRRRDKIPAFERASKQGPTQVGPSFYKLAPMCT